MKIVDDFTSADNVDQYKNKAKQIVDYWLGDNHGSTGSYTIPTLNRYISFTGNAVRTINSIIYVSRDL